MPRDMKWVVHDLCSPPKSTRVAGEITDFEKAGTWRLPLVTSFSVCKGETEKWDGKGLFTVKAVQDAGLQVPPWLFPFGGSDGVQARAQAGQPSSG